ncbi:MAG: hypothetical protein HY313_07955 [Acidobacteria bacterium]|nr:hypothetical protein [Acidobacteriota bacterium]
MASKPLAALGENLGNSLQKAVVSMVRFSSALALYGMENMQTAISFQKGGGLPKAAENLEAVLDSMAQCLADQMEQNNQEALKSATKIAEQVVQQSVETMTLLDPRRMVKVANNLVQKSTEAISPRPGKQEAVEDHDNDKPRLAVEILTTSNP